VQAHSQSISDAALVVPLLITLYMGFPFIGRVPLPYCGAWVFSLLFGCVGWNLAVCYVVAAGLEMCL
jgi:hypothetical protein